MFVGLHYSYNRNLFNCRLNCSEDILGQTAVVIVEHTVKVRN